MLVQQRGRKERLNQSSRIWVSLGLALSLAILLQLVSQLTESTVLFLLELPGILAVLGLWGIHSGAWNTVHGSIVSIVANTLIYWPIILGLFSLYAKRKNKVPR